MRQDLQPTARKIVTPRNGAPTLCAQLLRAHGRVLALAIRAQHAHEALGHHGFQRRRHEVRLDAHVHEARQRAGRVVGVQRGKNHVARQRRLHGDLRRFLIANFTDEDHVRVMPQNRAQSAREGQPRLLGNLNLVDALELILDRVFDGDDLAHGVVDLRERAVERRRLAAARRPGDQRDAVGHSQHVFEEPPVALGHAHARQADERPRPAAADA